MKWWFLCFLYVKTKDMSSIASGPCGSFLLILLFNLFQHFRMDSKWVGRKEEKTDIIKKGLIYDKLCLHGLEFGLLICMSYIFNDLNFIAFKCQIFLAKKESWRKTQIHPGVSFHSRKNPTCNLYIYSIWFELLFYIKDGSTN